jgi:hypothetical protein
MWEHLPLFKELHSRIPLKKMPDTGYKTTNTGYGMRNIRKKTASEKRQRARPVCSSSLCIYDHSTQETMAAEDRVKQNERPVCWHYESVGHLRRNCQKGYSQKHSPEENRLEKQIEEMEAAVSLCWKSTAMTVYMPRGR